MKRYILQLLKSMTFGIALALGSILGFVGVYAALNWDGLTANVENNTPLTKDLWNNTIGKLKLNIEALDSRIATLESAGGVTAVENSCFEFSKITGGYKIIKYYPGVNCRLDVVIPSSHKGEPVIQIGELVNDSNVQGVFRNMGINSVSIPSTLKTIGTNCFVQNNITSVLGLENVEYIGINAFNGNKLTSINLSNTLKFFGNSAFQGNLITTLTIPGTIENDSHGFYGGGQYPKNLTLGEGIKEVKSWAYQISDIQKLTLPNSLLKIGESSFYSAPSIVNIPNPNTTYCSDSFPSGTMVNGGKLITCN